MSSAWQTFGSIFTAIVVLLASVNCACATAPAPPTIEEHACCSQKKASPVPIRAPAEDRHPSCRHCNPSFATDIAVKPFVTSFDLARHAIVWRIASIAPVDELRIELLAHDLSPPPLTPLELNCRLTT